MIKNSYKATFFSTMMLGTLTVISSNSWISMWMGLEINLLSFIPLMMSQKNLFTSEASLKYFLIQAMASSTLLFGIIILYMFLTSKFNLSILMMTLMSSCLLLKSGAAPFHFWLPNVMEGLCWNSNLIILTWQKIAPILMLSYCMSYFLLTMSLLMSVIFGAIGGLNQTSLRKILAFSSINHLGWMMSGMLYSEILWETYFLFYVILNIAIIMLFNMKNIFNISQTFNFFYSSMTTKISMYLVLLSMGGLPPFLGFFPKWLIIESMIFDKKFFILSLILFFTLIALYYYLRISYSALLFSHFNLNWNFKIYSFSKTKKKSLLITFISVFGLFWINLMFFFI